MALISIDYGSVSGGGLKGFFERELTISCVNDLIGESATLTLFDKNDVACDEPSTMVLNGNNTVKVNSLGNYKILKNDGSVYSGGKFTLDDFNNMPNVNLSVISKYFSDSVFDSTPTMSQVGGSYSIDTSGNLIISVTTTNENYCYLTIPADLSTVTTIKIDGNFSKYTGLFISNSPTVGKYALNVSSSDTNVVQREINQGANVSQMSMTVDHSKLSNGTQYYVGVGSFSYGGAFTSFSCSSWIGEP